MKIPKCLLVLFSLIFLVISVANAQDIFPAFDHTIVSVAWSPDGTMIAGAGTDGFLRIWDAATGLVLVDFENIVGTVDAVTWSPDSTKLASSGHDSTIRIWDIKGTLLHSFIHTEVVLSLAWSPDGTQLASANVSETPTLRTWDVIKFQAAETFNVALIDDITWSPDSTRVAIADTRSGVYILDARLNESLETRADWSARRIGPESAAGAAAWSPNGNAIAIGGYDGDVSVWNVFIRQPIFSIQANQGWISSIAWNPDGCSLAIGALDGIVRIWDASNGRSLAIFQSTRINEIYSLAWSPDGTQLVYSGKINSSEDLLIEIVTVPTNSSPTCTPINTP